MASYKHFDPESNDWYDINPEMGVSPDEIKRQIANQQAERLAAQPPSAGDMINRGMETARGWLGGLGKMADDYIPESARNMFVAPASAASSAFIKAPQVAIEAIKNIAKPETYQPGAPDVLTAAAARPMIDEEMQRGPVENLARNVPDLAAMFSPFAGPVYGIPALEQSKTGFESGHPLEGAANLAMAAGAGVGGLASTEFLSRGPKVEAPIPENLLAEKAHLEHSFEIGNYSEAAATRLDDINQRIDQTANLERAAPISPSGNPELDKMLKDSLKDMQDPVQMEAHDFVQSSVQKLVDDITPHLSQVLGEDMSGIKVVLDTSTHYDGATKTIHIDPDQIGLHDDISGDMAAKTRQAVTHELGHIPDEATHEFGDFGRSQIAKPEDPISVQYQTGAPDLDRISIPGDVQDISFDASRKMWDAERNDARIENASELTQHYEDNIDPRAQSGNPKEHLFNTAMESIGNHPEIIDRLSKFEDELRGSPHAKYFEDLQKSRDDFRAENKGLPEDKPAGNKFLPDEIQPGKSLKNQLDEAWAESDNMDAADEGTARLRRPAPIEPSIEQQPISPAASEKLTWQDFLKRPESKGKKPKQLKLEFDKAQAAPPGEPPAPPKGPIKELPPDIPPDKLDVRTISKLSAFKPVVHNLTEMDPALGASVRGYLDMSSQMEGEFHAYYDRWTKGIDPAGKDVIRQVLEGAVDPKTIDPKLADISGRLRNLLETTYNMAEKVGLEPAHRENYFPHVFEKGKGPKRRFDLDPFENEGFSGREDPHLEKARKSDRKDYIKNLDVLKNYFSDTSRRIAEANYFGPRWEKVKALTDDLAASGKRTEQYVKTSMRRLTGRETQPYYAGALGKLRHAQALSDLAFAAPLQLSQFSNTAARGGLMRSMRITAKLMLERARGKGGVGGDAFVKAMASGALKPDSMMELTGHTSEGFPIFKNPMVENFVNGMYGVGRADRAMRIHSYSVGEELFNEAKAGNKGAAKLIADLKLPEKHSAAEVGRALSDTTQFRTGVGEMPLWASSSTGKLVYQYLHFAYRQSIFMGEIFRSARQGNFKPLATILALGAGPVGEVVNDVRAVLRGQEINPTEKDTPWDDRKWEENLKAAFKNKRVTWKHPAMRMLQNFGTIGGFGLVQNMVDRLSQRDASLAKLALGPVAANAEDLGQKIASGVRSKNKPKNKVKAGLKGAAEWGLEQIPGYGYNIARKVFPKDKKPIETGY